MWSGALDAIPAGWSLCDGSNGTPDLTDTFVKGVADPNTDPGTVGGSENHIHNTNTVGVAAGSDVQAVVDVQSATEEPPHYEVAYIQKQ